LTSEKDKAIADKIIRVLQLFNLALEEARRAKLEVDIRTTWDGKRNTIYVATIYRRQDTIIAASAEVER
jgi:hypothetical protein